MIAQDFHKHKWCLIGETVGKTTHQRVPANILHFVPRQFWLQFSVCKSNHTEALFGVIFQNFFKINRNF